MPSQLQISRELAAIAQTGLAYSKDPFDIERFQRIHELASELLRCESSCDFEWPLESGYMTPKIDVRGVAFIDDKVILVRERSSSKWTVPGGWADVNLSPKENVEKEFSEETGYSVSADTLVSVYDRERAGYPPNAHSIYKLTFLCAFKGGEPTVGLEVSEIDTFALDSLPELDSHRIRVCDIERCHKFLRSGAKPADFN
jgi:ADP-ribose pyrophosphatase YjhB (NUDIX family)